MDAEFPPTALELDSADFPGMPRLDATWEELMAMSEDQGEGAESPEKPTAQRQDAPLPACLQSPPGGTDLELLEVLLPDCREHPSLDVRGDREPQIRHLEIVEDREAVFKKLEESVGADRASEFVSQHEALFGPPGPAPETDHEPRSFVAGFTADGQALEYAIAATDVISGSAYMAEGWLAVELIRQESEQHSQIVICQGMTDVAHLRSLGVQAIPCSWLPKEGGELAEFLHMLDMAVAISSGQSGLRIEPEDPRRLILVPGPLGEDSQLSASLADRLPALQEIAATQPAVTANLGVLVPGHHKMPDLTESWENAEAVTAVQQRLAQIWRHNVIALAGYAPAEPQPTDDSSAGSPEEAEAHPATSAVEVDEADEVAPQPEKPSDIPTSQADSPQSPSPQANQSPAAPAERTTGSVDLMIFEHLLSICERMPSVASAGRKLPFLQFRCQKGRYAVFQNVAEVFGAACAIEFLSRHAHLFVPCGTDDSSGPDRQSFLVFESPDEQGLSHILTWRGLVIESDFAPLIWLYYRLEEGESPQHTDAYICHDMGDVARLTYLDQLAVPDGWFSRNAATYKSGMHQLLGLAPFANEDDAALMQRSTRGRYILIAGGLSTPSVDPPESFRRRLAMFQSLQAEATELSKRLWVYLPGHISSIDFTDELREPHKLKSRLVGNLLFSLHKVKDFDFDEIRREHPPADHARHRAMKAESEREIEQSCAERVAREEALAPSDDDAAAEWEHRRNLTSLLPLDDQGQSGFTANPQIAKQRKAFIELRRDSGDKLRVQSRQETNPGLNALYRQKASLMDQLTALSITNEQRMADWETQVLDDQRQVSEVLQDASESPSQANTRTVASIVRDLKEVSALIEAEKFAALPSWRKEIRRNSRPR